MHVAPQTGHYHQGVPNADTDALPPHPERHTFQGKKTNKLATSACIYQ